MSACILLSLAQRTCQLASSRHPLGLRGFPAACWGPHLRVSGPLSSLDLLACVGGSAIRFSREAGVRGASPRFRAARSWSSGKTPLPPARWRGAPSRCLFGHRLTRVYHSRQSHAMVGLGRRRTGRAMPWTCSEALKSTQIHLSMCCESVSVWLQARCGLRGGQLPRAKREIKCHSSAN